MNKKVLFVILIFIIGCTNATEPKDNNSSQDNFNLEEYYSDNEVKAEPKAPSPSPLTGGATKEIKEIQKEEKSTTEKTQAESTVKSVKQQLIQISRKLKLNENNPNTNNTTLKDKQLDYEMARDMLTQAEKDLGSKNYNKAIKNAEVARDMADKIEL